MGRFRNSLLIQFSVTSFLIMVAIAVVVSVILRAPLNRNVGLLEIHGAAMMAGTMIKEEDSFSITSIQGDLGDLRWITIGAVAGGFVILYGSLVMIVWSGSRTISSQQVDALNRLLQGRTNVLLDEVSNALSVARDNPFFGISREYQELVEELSALVTTE